MPATVATAAALDDDKLGQAVREAEAALCRIRAASAVMLPAHLARRAVAPLHALGLARAASVVLVGDSEPFYPLPVAPADGPECGAVPWLPGHPADATAEHWARLDADVAAADDLLRGLVKGFFRHCHASDRWAEVARSLDEFWAATLAGRVMYMAGPIEVEGRRGQLPASIPKRRPSNAGRRPLGRGPLVPLEVG